MLGTMTPTTPAIRTQLPHPELVVALLRIRQASRLFTYLDSYWYINYIPPLIGNTINIVVSVSRLVVCVVPCWHTLPLLPWTYPTIYTS